MNIFTVLTPVIYWFLIVIWSFILFFYLKRLRAEIVKGQLLYTLLIILAIDAFRTLFESIYFGAWYTSLAGFLPKAVFTFLVRPEMVFIPKILNAMAAVVVLVILIYKWLPQEEQEKSGLEAVIKLRTNELLENNEQLEKEINERRLAEAALIDSQSRLRKMMEKSPLPMIITEKGEDILFFNDKFTELFGYTLDDVATVDEWRRVAYPDEEDRSEVARSWAEAIDKAKQAVSDIEMQQWEITVKDGTKRYCEFHMVPLDDYSLIIMNDITDKKRGEEKTKKLETQLQQAQKMESIGTLAGGIAHDLNNILFPIVGHSEILLEDVPADMPYRDNINEIFTSALRAKDLVAQILTFSRQESRELKLMRIQPVLTEVLKLIRASFSTAIDIEMQIQEDCGAIKADPTQIHQIIMNLATNAYHAMEGTGGEITIALKEVELGSYDIISPDIGAGTYACLSITDTGTGIDKAHAEKIFDPFFTTKELGKGTGMGLSVVYGIVQSLGGAIRFYSESGKGTSFQVYLPVVKKHFEDDTLLPNEKKIGGSERILLVDDEIPIIKMEEQLLGRLGYLITSYTDSIEALEAFRSTPYQFDLVITDMAMPGMTGEQLSVEMLRIRPDLPILLCTGFSEKGVEEKAVSLGVKGCLLKPLILNELSLKIREVLDTK